MVNVPDGALIENGLIARPEPQDLALTGNTPALISRKDFTAQGSAHRAVFRKTDTDGRDEIRSLQWRISRHYVLFEILDAEVTHGS